MIFFLFENEKIFLKEIHIEMDNTSLYLFKFFALKAKYLYINVFTFLVLSISYKKNIKDMIIAMISQTNAKTGVFSFGFCVAYRGFICSYSKNVFNVLIRYQQHQRKYVFWKEFGNEHPYFSLTAVNFEYLMAFNFQSWSILSLKPRGEHLSRLWKAHQIH